MRLLSAIQVGLCLFATVWLTTAAYSGWKAGPPASKSTGPSAGWFYYGGSTYGGGSRSSGGSWGGGK
jgi:hypothetical protein